MKAIKQKLEMYTFISIPFIVVGSVLIYNALQYGSIAYIGF